MAGHDDSMRLTAAELDYLDASLGPSRRRRRDRVGKGRPRGPARPGGRGGGGGHSLPPSSRCRCRGRGRVRASARTTPPSVALLTLGGGERTSTSSSPTVFDRRRGTSTSTHAAQRDRSPISTMSSRRSPTPGPTFLVAARRLRRSPTPIGAAPGVDMGVYRRRRPRLAVAHVRRTRRRVPRRRRRRAHVTDRHDRVRRRLSVRRPRALPRRLRSRRPAVEPVDRDPGHLRWLDMTVLHDDLAREPRPPCTQRGADVVFHAAGDAGSGVFAAAREHPSPRAGTCGRSGPTPTSTSTSIRGSDHTC